VSLSDRHQQLLTTSEWDFSDLRAVMINCTLKRSPEVSNTGGIPAHGNQRAGWDAGCRYDFANPGHR
jgi:hypothetical protein